MMTQPASQRFVSEGTLGDPDSVARGILSTTFVAFRNADGTPAPSLRTIITLDAFGEPDDIITEEV